MKADYDLIADDFNNARQELLEREKPYFLQFVSDLPAQSSVIDVGCGTGMPIARYLIEHGHKVIGIDASEKLIGKARQNFPAAEFEIVDMRTFNPLEKFDGLVAWDSLFFLHPSEHERMYQKLVSWLNTGGLLIGSVGGSAGHFTSPMFGHDFEFGAVEPDTAKAIFERAGCKVLKWEVDDPSSRGHIAFLLRKES
jgi:SAM-dependent methyltransferase